MIKQLRASGMEMFTEAEDPLPPLKKTPRSAATSVRSDEAPPRQLEEPEGPAAKSISDILKQWEDNKGTKEEESGVPKPPPPPPPAAGCTPAGKKSSTKMLREEGSITQPEEIKVPTAGEQPSKPTETAINSVLSVPTELLGMIDPDANCAFREQMNRLQELDGKDSEAGYGGSSPFLDRLSGVLKRGRPVDQV